MEERVQKITTKGLISKEGKILMVRDKIGNWELPGGCIKFWRRT